MTDNPALKRVERALVDLDADKRPSADWQQRVLAATPVTKEPILTRWSIVVLAVAAVVIVWLARRDKPSEPSPSHPALAVAIQPRETRARGHSALTGDSVKVAVAGARHLALWIYRSDELVLACPGAPPCTQREEMLEATFELQTIGTYSVVALSSTRPIPPPKGAMDSDVAAALSSGAEHRIEQTIVR